MLGDFLIGLREGLEAALGVSILVASSSRTDRRRVLPKVWLGVGFAVAIGVGVTLVWPHPAGAHVRGPGGARRFAVIIAVGFVAWMIFWMRRTTRTVSAHLRGKLEDAIEDGFDGRRRHGRAGRRSRGPGDRAVLLPRPRRRARPPSRSSAPFLGIAVAKVLAYLLSAAP